MVTTKTMNTALVLSIPSSAMASIASSRSVTTTETKVTIASQVENSPNSLGANILAMNSDPTIGIDWATNVPAKTDETCFQKFLTQFPWKPCCSFTMDSKILLACPA